MRAWVETDDSTVDVTVRPERFEDFYRVSSVEVYRTLTVVLRDADLAQEAMDEAKTRAFARWSKVRGYGNPAGWVYRVALNGARSRLRRRNREVPVDPEPPGYVDPIADPQGNSRTKSTRKLAQAAAGRRGGGGRRPGRPGGRRRP